MEVRGENQIGSFRHLEREAIGQFERATTKRPAAETAGDSCDRICWRIVSGAATSAKQSGETATRPTAAESHTTAHAAAKPWAGIARVALARGARCIEEEQTMVHDGTC